MTMPRAVLFDLLTALLDSWSVWNAAAGSEASGRAWRAEYLRLTYGCGSMSRMRIWSARLRALPGLACRWQTPSKKIGNPSLSGAARRPRSTGWPDGRAWQSSPIARRVSDEWPPPASARNGMS